MIRRIRNIWLRRFALLLVGLPLMAVIVICEMLIGAIRGFGDAMDAVENAWANDRL